jgi:hypothetical protein
MHLLLKHCALATVFGITLSGAVGVTTAAELPSYFKGIVGTQSASPAEIGTKDILQLNTTMFELYGDAAQIFKKNILAQHPLILGLFSGAGGRFILYRPGMAPIDAPQVPIVYQLLKSVGHSTMALAEVVTPYLNSPNDLTWRGSLAAYRSRMQSALDSLDATEMRDDWRPVSRSILQNNIAFMDECLKNNAISADALQQFSKTQSPLLKKNIAWAAQTQVAHWMGVIGGWKEMLGADWDKTYAASKRRPSEQRPVQRARAVLRAASHQRPADPDRDRFVHHDAERHAGLADPDHCRSGRRRRVLR